MDVHSGAAIVDPLPFLSEFDHARGHVTVCVRVEVVAVVSFVDGDVQVSQVELDDGFGVSRRHADTLDPLPHHCAL